MKPYAYDRRDEHGSIQLHEGSRPPRVRADEKLIPLYSAEQVAELREQVRLLTEQRDAVVAENVGLRTPENWLQHSEAGNAAAAIADGNGATEDEALLAGMKAIIECIDVPATDAAIAALRAEGVEMFAVTMHADISEADALEFARQLRESKGLTMSKFIVIQQFAWCNESGTGIEYASDLEEHDTRDSAIEHGFSVAGCDDFNIGVVENGCLVSFDYMDRPVGNGKGVNSDTLAQIAELIGLESVESKGAQG